MDIDLTKLPIDMRMLGEAILYSSIQFSIGSVEMSSKFSVKNFSKDQETLQNAADALSDYIKIGLLWTLGVVILLQCNYGLTGAVVGILMNALIIGWIYISYINSFTAATKKYKLKMPEIKLMSF
jgi:hypothetical protein